MLCYLQGIKWIKKIKLHVDKDCDFRAKVKVDPSLSEAHKSLMEVFRMEIEVIFTRKQTVIENDMEMKDLQRLIQGLAKENQLRLVLGPRSRLT